MLTHLEWCRSRIQIGFPSPAFLVISFATAKRPALNLVDSGPRNKREDSERAERVRQMWLKDLRKIIGSWTVGSEATKRSESDYRLDASETVKPERVHKLSRVSSPVLSSDLIELVVTPTQCPNPIKPVATVNVDQLFCPIPRRPYAEMPADGVPQDTLASPPSTMSVDDPVQPNPFASIDLSGPMSAEMTRVRPRRTRISGKQATTTGCYLVVIFILWVIIRIASGKLRLIFP